MGHPLLLGIDVGTSSIKASLLRINEEESVLEVIKDLSQPLNIFYGPEGKVEQNPMEYFEKTWAVMRQIFSKYNSKIMGIGFSVQCPTLIFLDKKGSCLNNAILYMDRRAKNVCEDLIRSFGEETLFQWTKNVSDPYFAGYKLIWLSRERRKIYDDCAIILSLNSFLAYKLCGAIAIDWITACTFAPFYDWDKMHWNMELLNELGLDPDKLPREIVPPYEIVGSLKPEIGKELGLTEEIPVVIGTADAQAAALAAGATSANESIMICGTTHLWEIIQSEEPKFMKYFINCHYIFPGLYLSAAALMTTGAVIDWFLKNFLMTTPENSFQMLKTLESQARVIKPGSEGIIVLPYFMGERSPIWDPNAKGLFLGLSLRHTSAHLYRAILEGIAYALKSCEEIFESAGLMPSEVIAIDGASKNKLWMEIISSVLRIPIKSPRPRLSSAAGAGILAGYGVGIFKKKEDLKKFLSYEIIAEPNPKESEEYEKLYQIFKKLYPALKEYMHAL